MRGIVLGLVLAITSYCSARARNEFISVVGDARPPIGWVEFCVEYAQECAVPVLEARDLILTERTWNKLMLANALVNRVIKSVSDLEHWGVIERWSYPDDGKGDCEEFVLLKRKTLMEAGLPRQALLITVVRDKKGEGHAVLTVKTTRGEFILDNLTDEILMWSKTGYRFVKRQSQQDPNVWVTLDDPRTP